MAKQGVKTATPRLRFPEFRDWPAWSQKRLASISNSESSSVALNKLSLQFDGFPVYGADGIVGYIDGFAQRDRYIAIVKDGSGVGRLALLPGESTVIGTLAYIKTSDETQARLDWLFHTLSTVNLQKYVKGSGIPHIYFSDFSNEIVGVPGLEEQQKIADCLTSLDEVIAAQGRKVEALKAHKRGLMQQLFPREGETRPRLRFPEFRNAQDWIRKRLDDVSPSIFDGTHQTPTYTVSGIPFYSVENLISGNANKYISREDYLLATKKNKPEKGDVLFTRIGKIGHSQVVTWEHEFSVYVTLAVIKMSDQVIPHFLHYAIQSNLFQAEVRSKSLHNAVPPKINMDSLRSVQFLIADLAEQQRIADCLSSLDAQIAADTAQLAALKTHKQGLMQQLFPAPEAASA